MNTVIVNGAQGKMGRLAAATLQDNPNFQVVAELGRQDDLSAALQQHRVDIVVDFTNAAVVYENTKKIITAGCRPVIGTTGLKPEEIKELDALLRDKSLGGLVIPNFSIAAILMMRFAAEAARFFPHVEIIEMHHDGKMDSPSGTAIKTADMIAASRTNQAPAREDKAIIPHARGAVHHDIHIHAIRLPGFVANQEVIFGGVGETFSLHHQTIDRSCFMPGLQLACERVIKLNGLIYGLESLLT